MGMSARSLSLGLDSTWSYDELLASLGPQSLTPEEHPEGAFEYFNSPGASTDWVTPGYGVDSPLISSGSPVNLNFESTMAIYTVDSNDASVWQTGHTPPPTDTARQQSAESPKLVYSEASKSESSSDSTTNSTKLATTKKIVKRKKNNISLRTSRPKRKSKYTDSETDSVSPLGQPNPTNSDSIPQIPLDEDISLELHLARRTHNHVEKRYRTRLNLQFERLLAVLPSSDIVADDDRTDGQPVLNSTSEKLDKHVSKAEVLDMARQRICLLERENQHLRQKFGSYDQIYPKACGGIPGPHGAPHQTPQYQRAVMEA